MRSSIPAFVLALFSLACGGGASPAQEPPPVEHASDDTVEQLRLHQAVDREAEGYDAKQALASPPLVLDVEPHVVPEAPRRRPLRRWAACSLRAARNIC